MTRAIITVVGKDTVGIIARSAAAGTAHQGDGGDTDAFVDNGDAKLLGNVFARLDEVASKGRNLLVYLLTRDRQVLVGTIEQTDAHRDGADIEILLLNHLVGLYDFL